MSEQQLTDLVEQNQTQETAAFFHGMPEAQRRSYAPLCLKLLKQVKKSDKSVLAAEAAVLATGTLSELKAVSWRIERETDLAYAILADRKPEWLGERAEQLLKQSYYWFHWALIRRLVRAGLMAKPQTPNYYLAMIGGITGWHETDISLEKLLLDDPELLNDEVWRLFEFEGAGENSLANWDRFGRSQTWQEALLNLAQAGRLPRARLLTCTLEALERDFNQYRARWFATFHDALAPSPDELRQHAPRYLRLLGVSTPSIVSWALEIVKAMVQQGIYNVPELIAGLRPVLESRQKGVARQALALLSAAAQSSDHVRQAVQAAVAALGHEAVDVQKAALDLIDQHAVTVDAEIATSIAGYANIVAASLRSRLARWTSETSGPENKTTPEKTLAVPKTAPRKPARNEPTLPELAAEWKALFGIDALLANLETQTVEIPAAPFDGTEIPRLKESHRVMPIENLDDLIDVCARVVEDDGQVDDAERAIDGLSRLCDLKPDDFSVRIGPLAKRVTQRLKKETAPFLGNGPGDDLCGLIHAWTTGDVIEWQKNPDPKNRTVVATYAGEHHNWFKENLRKALGFLSRRSIALAKRIAVGQAMILLSAPTHKGGWIASKTLVERVNGWSGPPPDQTDVCLSLLRLAPDGRAEALKQLKESKSEWEHAVRYALGGKLTIGKTGPLWIAAARARSPWTDDEDIERAFPAAGPDAGQAATYAVSFATKRNQVQLQLKSNPPPPKSIDPDCVTVTLHAQRGIGRELTWELGGACGRTIGSVRWTATIWPLARESLFAASLDHLADNIDWWEAAWQNKALLEPLLDSSTPLRTMGLYLLVTALAAKEPGEHGLATDIAIRAIEDGRLGTDNLGASLAQFLPTGLIKPGRWHKTLSDVARMSPVHALVIQRSLQTALCGDPAKMPRDYAKLLDLLYELSIELGQNVSDQGCLTFLTQLKSAGKAGKTAQSLLALPAKEFSTACQPLMLLAIEQRMNEAKRRMSPESAADGHQTR